MTVSNAHMKGKGGISAKVIADSIDSTGKRITTFEIEVMRFVWAEFMTHRLFSRNAASSRAIPVKKMLEQIEKNPAMPIHWGANQKGMQADAECNNEVCGPLFVDSRIGAWNDAKNEAISYAKAFDDAGYHKQIVNRLTEPFAFIKAVVTATEYDNFFHLRRHKDAQPEIQELARCMFVSREMNDPQLLNPGEWHVPYVSYDSDTNLYYIDNGDDDITKGVIYISKDEAIKLSASCCAQVSYRTLNQGLTVALNIYNKLAESKPPHLSPFEHQATPRNPAAGFEPGITSRDRNGNYWSGNFMGWIQNRQIMHSQLDYDPFGGYNE